MKAIGTLFASCRALGGAAVLTTAAVLSGCSSVPVAPAAVPSFAAVQPLARPASTAVTGSIYNGRQVDNWFGRGRNFQVGDVITVLLDERTQAARSQRTNVLREASNDVVTEGALEKITRGGGLLGGIRLNGLSNKSEGSGNAGQEATLTGSLAVSVVEVLSNGNLVVRGEKQLSLSEGSEVIQVAGVIRPEDVAPNNTVLSRRLAHSQISYRGSGELAAAAKPGWGTSLINRFWPF